MTCWVCSGAYDHDGAYCRSAECLSEMRRRAGSVGRRPPVTDVRYIEIAGYPYVQGIASVARFLSEALGRPVTRRQADAWRARADRNGFPRELWVTTGGGIERRIWDPDELSSWASDYVPSKGGAPVGSRNGSWRNGSHRRYDDAGQRVRTS
mgnify:CR=1 FL=1